uniref:Uncharacterized protein n=1 Tax=Anguilla anguilla TaxID=7936 RepID=A0A0E9V856_ANGAN
MLHSTSVNLPIVDSQVSYKWTILYACSYAGQ